MAIRNEINKRLEGMNTALEKIYGLQTNKAVDQALMLAYSSFDTWVDDGWSKLLLVQSDEFLNVLSDGDFDTNLLDKLAELLHLTIALLNEKQNVVAAQNMQTKLQKLVQFINERDRTFSLQREMWVQDADNKNIETK